MSDTLTPPSSIVRRASRGLLDLLTGPHGVDRYVELIDPAFATDRHVAEVVAVHRETDDVVTLTLTPPDAWAKGRLPRPRHGQAVNLTVEVDGRRHTRSFSVASLTPTRWTVTIRANPTGTVSRHLVATARPGLPVEVGAPFGSMVLPADHGLRDGLLLVSGGSGITPVMSMLRELRRAGRLAPHGSAAAAQPGVLPQIAFLHYARTPKELIFAGELAELADGFVNLDLVVVHTGDGAPDGNDRGLRGHFTGAHAAALDIDATSAQVFVCGPAPLTDAVSDWLGDDARLHRELFHPPSAPEGESLDGTLTLAATDTAIASDGRSILEQAEAAGLTPEHGCRMGICHTCTRQVTAGSVRNVLNGEVATATETAPVEAQICVSTPHGDCTVDL